LKKIRQHVNPLGEHFMRVRARPLERPAHLAADCRVEVELGCADAEFSFQLAALHPDWLVAGLEIREPCLVVNRRLAHESGLPNLVFAYSNLNVDLDQVFPPASVDCFHLLFPDPWFKERHHKRRVIEPALATPSPTSCAPAASCTPPATCSRSASRSSPCSRTARASNLAGPWSFWRGNPFDAASRREQTTLARGQRVWRTRFVLT
jgi:tRNA (guanine-N7-)-methyltransferase